MIPLGFGFGDIASNLLASAIWLTGAGLAIQGGRAVHARRATCFSRLAQIPPKMRFIHLAYGLVALRRSKTGTYVQEGDVSAVCSAQSLLEGTFGAKRVCILSASAAHSMFGSLDHIVSISGPIWNPITRALLERSRVPVKFESVGQDDMLCIGSGSDEQRFGTRRVDAIPRECYAVVFRGSADIAGDKRSVKFLVCAGISALGTYGAVTWLRSAAARRLKHNPFIKGLKPDEHAAIILKVCDQSAKGFTAYSSGSVTPGFLTIDVVAEIKESEVAARLRQSQAKVPLYVPQVAASTT